MPSSEFQLIRRYFDQAGNDRADVMLGVGDDCALLTPPSGTQLAVTTDTLVAGIHFFPDVDPEALGHKSLAVNLSDLAAMGATPAWVTLAISLPEVNQAWLEGFSRGFFNLAQRYRVALVGGDTTRGPLSITVQATGFVDGDLAMRRDRAQPGDLVCVSGELGDAALALALMQQEQVQPHHAPLIYRLERPEPMVELGQALSGVCDCAIDISDGLIADLGHIAVASEVRIDLQLSQLPMSDPCREYVEGFNDWRPVVAGGDDYQLALVIRPEQRGRVEAIAAKLGVRLSVIGVVGVGRGVHCLDASGQAIAQTQGGYDHFQS